MNINEPAVPIPEQEEMLDNSLCEVIDEYDSLIIAKRKIERRIAELEEWFRKNNMQQIVEKRCILSYYEIK
jgi:hypothetical protein